MADEDQGSEETESEETSETEGQEDNQETKDQEQSNESEEKRYKLSVDGKEQELTAEEMHEWAQKVNPEFTRRSQELAKYRKEEEERKTRAGSEARQTIEEDEILKNMPPDAKAALEKFIQASMDKGFKRYDQAQEQGRRDRAFDKKVADLEDEFPGGDGKPKFDKEEVILAMKQPGNANFDPRSKFMELKSDDFLDLKVKQALKKQKGGVETERTGTSGPRKPQKKVPKTFQEAAKSAYSRLKQSD